ncbi:hypothetical protein DASC09_030740 [Saccharomycopsis crataegensis]|uniref:non-specific serine/threonine protein kinase n=1 Tax=Saccharomycopsis crataegensis TaxID=43959 RepID=A0AAV5QM76_9ASCO|nr:hypothetical protein DASC09_030740 [Saccharomycopsis crataegensis]
MLSWKKKLQTHKKKVSPSKISSFSISPTVSPTSANSSPVSPTSRSQPRSDSSNNVNNPSSLRSGRLSIILHETQDLRLPFDPVYNEFILDRIASCGIDCDLQSIGRNLIRASQNFPNQQFIPGEIVTQCLPAVVSIMANEESVRNPLVYATVELDKNVSLVQPTGGKMANPKFDEISYFDVNSNSVMVIQLLIKIPNALIPTNFRSLVNPATPSQDILIGTIKVNLNYSEETIILDHEWLSLQSPMSIRTLNNSGSVRISIHYKPNASNTHLAMHDFDLLKVIGKGSFGKVMQVRKKDTKRVYALKSIRKAPIVAKFEVGHTLAERNVLAEVNNPFIVSLKFAFQSPDKLYFVLPYISGGELFHHLQKEGRFSLGRSRLYVCELLSAIEHLHNFDVIYRDLKPENILIDYQGHIALCDFGLCKMDMGKDDRTDTFCGTPEYLAPELLLGQGYTRSVDWWTLGILLYEMLTGLPPFYDEDVSTMYKKILGSPLKFPEIFDSHAKDFLERILNRDPGKRLGTNGSIELKQHPFFMDVDWVKLNNKEYTAPFKPLVFNAFDTHNFDSEFTNEVPLDSVVNDHLSGSIQQQFEGWSYAGGGNINNDMF